MVALVLGIVQFAAPKGTLPHRTIGWIWAALLLAIAISSFWIHGKSNRMIGVWSPIHLLSISVLFTVTADLTAAFPALAAREMGWVDVPLLCASEIPVPGSMPRCLRILLQVELRAPRVLDTHIYLGEAVALRPDIGK